MRHIYNFCLAARKKREIRFGLNLENIFARAKMDL